MNKAKNKLITLMFIISPLVFSQYARADVEQPTGRDTQITEYFDKQSIPTQVDIWTDESAGHDSSNSAKWEHNTLVCKSSSDPKNGQCNTGPDTSGTSGVQSIPLIFTEKRSQLKVAINVSAYHNLTWSTFPCSNSRQLYIYTSISSYCEVEGSPQADGTMFTAYLTQSEIKKLPVGGVWEAKLQTLLTQWSPRATLANWNATITFNMSDNANQAIYFPGFGEGQGKDAAPHVDLNLRPLPGGDRQVLGKLSGSTSLDMCLYDGYGSNSRQFQVQFSEPPEYPANPAGRNPGQFSVYNDISDRSKKADRLDYGVKMYFPESNSFQDVVNGEIYTLPNINTDDIRAVRLASNIPNPVLCVPTPLQINTPAFNIVEKNNGHYTGKIRVIFTPSLW
ncbi:CfaE/CblD family pilus tip adhesin [Rahnella sikkimica]|uniref:CblD like pilus biogenesis initiator n=1 Tax=Rahnella sikkimica TaxID=1805933 RepID=A0A2L1UTN6_9GAMM|nr:CfaE/CblD family pilus tip adhesin [Rahnella sikkimica]AVF36313.1 hypothetical protein BV494_15855 [Rahnella sikkimica]